MDSVRINGFSPEFPLKEYKNKIKGKTHTHTHTKTRMRYGKRES